MELEERIVDLEVQAGDGQEHSLRPDLLSEFIGQDKLKDNLKIFIEATKSRGTALDHVLLYGPPGLGKTSLSHILSKELGVGFRGTSGPVIEKAGDLAAILTSLEPHDVLFIDEIHRLSAHVEEILYPAMEDFSLDIIIGEGPAARTVKVDVPPFTLVGATTRAGMLSNPLRDRFGVQCRMEFYTPEQLVTIISRAATLLNVKLDPEGALEIAKRSRGTPRIANRLLKRVRDFAAVENNSHITQDLADRALTRLEVDHLGLDNNDHRYLDVLVNKFGGGPTGLDTLAASMAESRDTIEDVIEPFLLQLGFVQRTPKGRVVTQLGQNHISEVTIS